MIKVKYNLLYKLINFFGIIILYVAINMMNIWQDIKNFYTKYKYIW